MVNVRLWVQSKGATNNTLLRTPRAAKILTFSGKLLPCLKR
jgi:hypothetical protein